MTTPLTRRLFVQRIAGATGALVLAPFAVACNQTTSPNEEFTRVAPGEATPVPTREPIDPPEAAPSAMPTIPTQRPADWDALAFNRRRGNAGAIPESYRADINGPDGDTQHLGKHLPFVASLAAGVVPAGMLAIMWGDPSKGYAQHPNAASTEQNPEGHWYNWIRLRKASAGDAPEAESHYRAWPAVQPGDNGAFVAREGDDPAAADGKNTVYLAELPPDVGPGDWVRVHAHCLTHGEYVDFLQLPG